MSKLDRFFCANCGDKCTGYTNYNFCVNCGGHILFKENWAIFEQAEAAIRPIEDRILIKEDEFKSRYDCKTCGGKGHTGKICTRCNGTKVYVSRFDKITNLPDLSSDLEPCPDCTVRGVIISSGNPLDITYGYELCPNCLGKQGTIIIPEDTKRRPTTGVILAIGSKVTEYNVGAKVLYHNYAGTEFEMYDTKLRIMRENDVLCEIRGLSPSNANEVQRTELNESGII